MASKIIFAFPILILGMNACNTTPSSDAPQTIASVPPGNASSVATTSASSPAALVMPATAGSRAFHYDLVLNTTDGKTNSRAAFSVDLTEATPGSISFAKNVSFSGGGRADTGARVKCRLTMEGDVPHLDIDAEITSLDATGKLRKASSHGGAVTPLGTPTVIMDSSDGGIQLKLTATPTASGSVDAKATDAPGDTYVVDVSVVHTGDGAPSAPTMLTLKIAGDAPAVANVTSSVPLSVSDAGAMSPRQDVGSRMKATAHAHGANLVLDFDFETSATEAAVPAARIRKIVARGELVAPFDKATTAFTGEEDGHRYAVTITPHRAK